MHAISQLQRDIRFQELVHPGQSAHGTHSPSIVSCTDGCSTQSSQLPLTATHSHGVQHLICPSMPTHHSQRSSNIGKGNKWQARPKPTARQQQHQHAVAQNTSGFQLQSMPFSSSPTKLVLLNEASSVSSSSAQTLVLSPTGSFSHHPSQPQPTNALVPVLQNTSSLPVSYYILDTMPPSPSQSQASIPCVISTQTGSNTQQSFYNYSNQSMVVANNSQQQPHQRYCYQQGRQYSPVPFQQAAPSLGFKQPIFQSSQQSQMVPLVFQPPPRERGKSPAPVLQDSGGERTSSQVQDVAKLSNNVSRSPQYQSFENRRDSSPITGHSVACTNDTSIINNNGQKQLPVVITSAMSSSHPSNGDLITSIQSTWLATQPLGNVHLVMGLSTGSTLKNNASSSIQEQNPPLEEMQGLPSPIARPSPRTLSSIPLEVRSEETKQNDGKNQNHNLLSDSSTSFDYTIEAEKMVSALCSSTPLKDMDDSEERQGETTTMELAETLRIADTPINTNKKNEMKSKQLIRKLRKSNERNEYSESSATCKQTTSMMATQNSNSESVNSIMYFPCTSKSLSANINSSAVSASNTDLSQFKYMQSHVSSRGISRSCSVSKIKDVGTLADRLCSKSQCSSESPCLEIKESKRERNTVHCQTEYFEASRDRPNTFQDEILRGFDEISDMLRNRLPSPTLNIIVNFCIAMKSTGIGKITDNSYWGRDRDALRKLIISFLWVARCWLYLTSERGIHDMSELMNAEIHEWFQQWQSGSLNMMEFLLKSITCTINHSSLVHNGGDWHSNQLIPSHNLSEASGEPLETPFSIYPQSCSSSTTLTDGICNTNHMISGQLLHNVIPSYLSSPCDPYGHNAATATPEQMKYFVSNTQTNNRHWRQRRFSDNQTDTANSNRGRKQKGGFVNTKEVNRQKWNGGSPLAPFPNCGDQKIANDSMRNVSRKTDDTSAAVSRPSGPERYSRQNTGNRFRQKSSSSAGKKSSPRGIHENSLRNKVLENLDGLSKQWQIYRKSPANEFQIAAQTPLSGPAFTGKATSEQCIAEVPRTKMTPLSQIEKRCHSADNQQHVDISAWFQNIGTSLTPIEPLPLMSIHSSPEITNHLTYANVRSPHQQCISSDAPLSSQNIDVSTSMPFPQHHAPRSRFSYQDSRNQVGNKNKSSQNRKNNYVIKTSTPKLGSNCSNVPFMNHDEPDSSDDTQDKVYMKPGSYDVPKRIPSTSTRNCVPVHISTPTKVTSPNNVALAFPAAPIVPPPPRRSADRNSKQIWNVLKTKADSSHSSGNHCNGSSDPSDLAWKAACESAGPFMEALQVQKQNEQVKPDSPTIDKETNEVKDLINGLKINCVHSCNGTVAETEEDGEETNGTDEKTIKHTPAAERRKFNVEKTDHWLIRTFKLNVSAEEVKEKSDTESLSTLNSTTSTSNSTCVTPETVPQQVTIVEDKNSNIEKPTSTVKDIQIADKRKSPDCTNLANGIVNPISSSSKNNGGKRGVVKENRRTGDEEQQPPRSRKSSGGGGNNSGGKKNLESSRSNSASRKRKLHERSPNNEVAVTSESPDGSKNKPEHRNKASWSVWYSSRRRRGLSQMAAVKLEDILNCIWNMEESEFIKYPISVSEYTKAVPQPMFLQTIAYKLRNRIYETIEQFVHDFRRIFYNSRLFNDEDSVYSSMTASLKNKLDTLLEDHFSGWDFTQITGDPNEQSTNSTLRYLAFSSNGKGRRAKSSAKGAASSVLTTATTNATRNTEVSSSTNTTS